MHLEMQEGALNKLWGPGQIRRPWISLVLLSLLVTIGWLISYGGTTAFTWILVSELSLAAMLIHPSVLFSIFIVVSLLSGYFAGVQLLSGLSGLDLVGVAMPVLLLSSVVFHRVRNVKLNKTHIVYMVFILYALLATFFSEGGPVKHRVETWLKLFNGFVVFVLASHFLSRREALKRFPMLLLLALLPLLLLTTPELLHGGSLSHRWSIGVRIDVSALAGGFYSPRFLAFALVLVLPFLLLRACTATKSIYRGLCIGAIAVDLYFLFLTYRRTAWIGALAILAVWLMFSFDRQIRLDRHARTALLGAVVAIALALFGTSHVGALMAELVREVKTLFVDLLGVASPTSHDHLLTGRWGVFRELYIRTLLDQGLILTLFGRGVGSTITMAQAAGFSMQGGHSNYFLVLFDFGLVGFSIYFGLIGGILLKAWRASRASKNAYYRLYSVSVVSLVVSYFVMSFTEHLLWHLTTWNWLFWVVLGPITSWDGER